MVFICLVKLIIYEMSYYIQYYNLQFKKYMNGVLLSFSKMHVVLKNQVSSFSCLSQKHIIFKSTLHCLYFEYYLQKRNESETKPNEALRACWRWCVHGPPTSGHTEHFSLTWAGEVYLPQQTILLATQTSTGVVCHKEDL